MRNISSKTDNVGDTLPAGDFNANLRSELQNLVESADFTLDPEGGADTDLNMFGKAVALYANAGWYYQESGSANAYVLTRVGNLKSVSAYKDGMTVLFEAGNANTGASTINVDSLGVKDLKTNTGAALTGGEISTNYILARYNSSGGYFEIVFNAYTALGQATETTLGIAELATQAEVDTGTDDLRIVTPLKLQAKVATETAKGIIERATQAEVDAGTDTERAITPATLAGSVVNAVAKAWVSFNGEGVVAIRDSLNVTSITDNGTGDYGMNFTQAMANANYAAAGMALPTTTHAGVHAVCGDNATSIPSTTQFSFKTKNQVPTHQDYNYIFVVVFGD